jgi:hypothetical protein
LGQNIARIRDEYGVSKEIWITETGNPGMAKAHARGELPKADYLREQSEFILKQHVVALSQGVQRIFWYNTWPDDLDDPDPEGWRLLALQDMRGNRRPGFYTYRSMVEKLQGLSSVQRVDIANGEAYEVAFDDGRRLYVVWNDDAADDVVVVDLSALLAGATATVTHIIDREGQEEPLVEKVRTDSIAVGESPIFVEP